MRVRLANGDHGSPDATSIIVVLTVDSRWRTDPTSAPGSDRDGTGSTLVVLQPGYLPWLGFFDQMRRADVFVYYDDVQFDKHGWRNRNRIKTPTGALVG